MNTPNFKGDKVLLRPINPHHDHIDWYEVSQDSRMHVWVGNTVPQSVEDVMYDLYELYPQHFLLWMIVDRQTNKVIGMMRLSHPFINDQGLLVAFDSQRLHSTYWRKGYMKEARHLIYDYAFNVLHIDRLYADVWEGNINSCKSLESVGYQHMMTKREYFKKYDRYQNKLLSAES